MEYKSPSGRYEWDIQDDIRTLERSKEIAKDPQRIKDIEHYAKTLANRANQVTKTVSRGSSNKATVGKLNVK